MDQQFASPNGAVPGPDPVDSLRERLTAIANLASRGATHEDPAEVRATFEALRKDFATCSVQQEVSSGA